MPGRSLGEKLQDEMWLSGCAWVSFFLAMAILTMFVWCLSSGFYNMPEVGPAPPLFVWAVRCAKFVYAIGCIHLCLLYAQHRKEFTTLSVPDTKEAFLAYLALTAPVSIPIFFLAFLHRVIIAKKRAMSVDKDASIEDHLDIVIHKAYSHFSSVQTARLWLGVSGNNCDNPEYDCLKRQEEVLSQLIDDAEKAKDQLKMVVEPSLRIKTEIVTTELEDVIAQAQQKLKAEQELVQLTTTSTS